MPPASSDRWISAFLDAIAAEQGVRSFPSGDIVIVEAAEERVVARAANDIVIAEAAENKVVARVGP